MKWIKCSERMPDLYQWVLVCNSPKGTNEPRCVNICRWDGKYWESLDSTTQYGDSPTFSDIIHVLWKYEITNWMPLPPEPENE